MYYSNNIKKIYDIFSKFTCLKILDTDKLIINDLIEKVDTKNIIYESESQKYYVFLFILYSNLFVEYIHIELDTLYIQKIIETILNTNIVSVIFNNIQ